VSSGGTDEESVKAGAGNNIDSGRGTNTNVIPRTSGEK